MLCNSNPAKPQTGLWMGFLLERRCVCLSEYGSTAWMKDTERSFPTRSPTLQSSCKVLVKSQPDVSKLLHLKHVYLLGRERHFSAWFEKSGLASVEGLLGLSGHFILSCPLPDLLIVVPRVHIRMHRCTSESHILTCATWCWRQYVQFKHQTFTPTQVLQCNIATLMCQS